MAGAAFGRIFGAASVFDAAWERSGHQLWRLLHAEAGRPPPTYSPMFLGDVLLVDPLTVQRVPLCVAVGHVSSAVRAAAREAYQAGGVAIMARGSSASCVGVWNSRWACSIERLQVLLGFLGAGGPSLAELASSPSLAMPGLEALVWERERHVAAAASADGKQRAPEGVARRARQLVLVARFLADESADACSAADLNARYSKWKSRLLDATNVGGAREAALVCGYLPPRADHLADLAWSAGWHLRSPTAADAPQPATGTHPVANVRALGDLVDQARGCARRPDDLLNCLLDHLDAGIDLGEPLHVDGRAGGRGSGRGHSALEARQLAAFVDTLVEKGAVRELSQTEVASVGAWSSVFVVVGHKFDDPHVDSWRDLTVAAERVAVQLVARAEALHAASSGDVPIAVPVASIAVERAFAEACASNAKRRLVFNGSGLLDDRVDVGGFSYTDYYALVSRVRPGSSVARCDCSDYFYSLRLRPSSMRWAAFEIPACDGAPPRYFAYRRAPMGCRASPKFASALTALVVCAARAALVHHARHANLAVGALLDDYILVAPTADLPFVVAALRAVLRVGSIPESMGKFEEGTSVPVLGRQTDAALMQLSLPPAKRYSYAIAVAVALRLAASRTLRGAVNSHLLRSLFGRLGWFLGGTTGGATRVRGLAAAAAHSGARLPHSLLTAACVDLAFWLQRWREGDVPPVHLLPGLTSRRCVIMGDASERAGGSHAGSEGFHITWTLPGLLGKPIMLLELAVAVITLEQLRADLSGALVVVATDNEAVAAVVRKGHSRNALAHPLVERLERAARLRGCHVMAVWMAREGQQLADALSYSFAPISPHLLTRCRLAGVSGVSYLLA